MIAIDTNILVYAHRADLPPHEVAYSKLTHLLRSGVPVGIPWPVVHEFIAVVSNPRAMKTPTPMPVALAQVDSWLTAPECIALSETSRHMTVLSELVAAAGVIGPGIHDARIAAICLEHGVDELWSADRDLTKFSGVRTVNPLTSD